MAISVDEMSDSVELAKTLDLPFPLLRDADLAVADAYGVAMLGREIAIPAVFVISRDKQIRFRYVGESQIDRPSVGDILAQVGAARR